MPPEIEIQSTGEILVVTGEKSARSLQHTPTSVAITTSRSIAEQNLVTAYDILDRTPNVVVDGNRTTFSIRGVDAFDRGWSGMHDVIQDEIEALESADGVPHDPA